MLELLQTHARERAAALATVFPCAAPFPHVVIDGFLDDRFCRELIDAFPAFNAAHAINELGEAGRKAVVPGIRRLGPAFSRFDDLMRSRDLLDWLSVVTGIPRLLYDPEYVGGGTHENLEGQELDPHVDFNFHPRTNRHRRLNLIVYLNPEWQPDWGGALELHRDPWPGGDDETSRIVPSANRCVVFETSERSWHGFRRIELPPDRKHLSRRSIAVYFYTAEPPVRGAAPSHGTIYVPRDLPDRIAPGRLLSEDDIRELRLLVARRDRQIRFLYERELKFSALIERMSQSPSFRIGRALTWPLRAVRAVVRR